MRDRYSFIQAAFPYMYVHANDTGFDILCACICNAVFRIRDVLLRILRFVPADPAPDPGRDLAPDLGNFLNGFQDANKNIFFCISYVTNCRNQGFSYFFFFLLKLRIRNRTHNYGSGSGTLVNCCSGSGTLHTVPTIIEKDEYYGRVLD